MGRLEDAEAVADVGRGGHPHPANRCGGQVGDDVPKHILRHDHVVVVGIENLVDSEGIDVRVVAFYVAVLLTHLVKDPPEERHAAKDVGLVHTGDPGGLVTGRTLAMLGDFKRKVRDPACAGPGNHHAVHGDVLTDLHPGGPGGIQTLGVLPQDDIVDRRVLGENRWYAFVALDGPDACVEIQDEPKGDLRCDLGAVGESNIRVTGRPEEDGIGVLAGLKGGIRQVSASLPVALRADGMLVEGEIEGGVGLPNGLEDLHGLGDHFRADPVAGENRDIVVAHGDSFRFGVLSLGCVRRKRIIEQSVINGTMGCAAGRAVPIPFARNRPVPRGRGVGGDCLYPKPKAV